MPATYALPRYKRSQAPPYHTVCHVFVGPGTAFEGPGGLSMKDFKDGQSNTFLVVEAGDPVPWTSPRNILYAPDQPFRLRGPFKDGFRPGMGDGSSRFIRYDVPEEMLRAAVTRNGGEKTSLDW